jgi:ABC-type nitrate/sulfonate/bicarbonate transport system permease component
MKYNKYLYSITPIIGFFVCWEVAVRLALINTGLFPSPITILSDLKELFYQETEGRSLLLTHLIITLKRLFYAAIGGTLVGFIVGVCIGLSYRFYQFFDPIITVIMPIPGIAMAPLFIIWLGFGNITIIAVGALAAFFPVTHNTSTGVRSIDRQLVRAAQIMGAKRICVLSQVYIPWSAVFLFTGIKLGLARCWRTVIAVEFVAAANWGLGYLIWDAAEYLRVSIVYGGIILLAITFTLIEKGFVNSFERMTIVKWGMIKA